MVKRMFWLWRPFRDAPFLSYVCEFAGGGRRPVLLQICLQHMPLCTEHRTKGTVEVCSLVYHSRMNIQVSSFNFPRLKEVDDVLGGSAAWENVDTTDGNHRAPGVMFWASLLFFVVVIVETCPKCGELRAYFMQMQTRSADEPMTIFFKCCNRECGNRWNKWLLFMF